MSNHQSLSESVLVSQVIDPQSDGAGISATAVDMSGWDGVLFIVNLGAFTADAVFDAYVQRSANANMSGPVNVTNAALVQVTNTQPNNTFLIDVYRPLSRYVQLVTAPATNTVIYGATAIRYRRTGLLPPTQAAAQTVKINEAG